MMESKPPAHLQLTVSPSTPGTPMGIPNLWAHTELMLRLRGDRPPLSGYDTESFLVHGDPGRTVDDLQRLVPWTSHRIDRGVALFIGEELFVELWARRRDSNTCQINVEARAATPEDARRAIESFRGILRERLAEPSDEFRVVWAFRSARDELIVASVEEAVVFRLVDAAYPTLHGGVHAFIDEFLSSPECVLVLQGGPGTGKTQLIRAIAAAMSRRKGRTAEVLYSNDERVLNSDEFFVKFAIGDADAMILEDADHSLLPRSRGNTELHRMLSVSDGLIRAQGRKMIFSTNLPNLHDLDDALIRPGRCHGCLKLRALTADEATNLLVTICVDGAHVHRAREALAWDPHGNLTVADIYRAARRTTPAAPTQPVTDVALSAGSH